MKIIVLLTILITVSFSSLTARSAVSDSVTVTFNVIVPESTPSDVRIFWAGTLNMWDPGDEGRGMSTTDLSKPTTFQNGIWTVQLTAPTADTVRYKYTRGSVFSVEERADYNYREPRTIVFDRNKTIRDTVEAWHDIPPKAFENRWPTVPLETVKSLSVTYNEMPMNGSGTLLYDRDMLSNFYDPDEWNTEINGIPETLMNLVFYFQRVSYAPDNTVLVVAAGQAETDGEWNVYVDQNNDNCIDHDEFIFTTVDSLDRQEHTVNVQIQQLHDGKPINTIIPFSIAKVTDLPPGYRSSAVAGAPNLIYELPFKNRIGQLNGQTFYLSTLFELHFRESLRVLVDYNRNDTLEMGSGSNESTELDLTQMYREQKFFIHPAFTLGDDSWEVANVDWEGSWIRLRPARETARQESLTIGSPAPTWNTTTVEGTKLSSDELQGTYVLRDFWGSWCGPCIQAIPKLKEVYERFRSTNFTIIGFAYESEASLQQALDIFELPWPQVLDEQGAYSSRFLVKGYPTYYLIGPNGSVVAMGSDLRGEQLIPTLEKFLK